MSAPVPASQRVQPDAVGTAMRPVDIVYTVRLCAYENMHKPLTSSTTVRSVRGACYMCTRSRVGRILPSTFVPATKSCSSASGL